MSLKIADNLNLPLDAVTKTIAIIAQRRKGKTYTANVIAEEMINADIPWVALDPTGAWWGLRSSASGKSAGLPVYVFGGDHGDLPLERTAGKMIADLVVDHPAWYILDFSHFESKEAERQLATDFAERFYRRKGVNKSPMHLFVDEADMFAPQRTPSGDQRMLGAFESIVRRGGIRGVGTTLITQRAAVLNKNVLEQIDMLITLRTVGPNDRKAIAGYVEANGTTEQQRELMDSLASLELGEAWIWEPGTDLFKRTKIRKRQTYNSSATPDSSAPAVIATLAKVDLEKIRDQMAATIERAEADDPKALRRRIAELEKEQAGERAHPLMKVQEKIIEVEKPILTEEQTGVLREVGIWLRKVESKLGLTSETNDGPTYVEPRPVLQFPEHKPSKLLDNPLIEIDNGERKLSKAARAILGVLAQFPAGRTKQQLSILSGYSIKSSSFSNALSELRSSGYATTGLPISITPEGLATAGDVDPAPRGRALAEFWSNRLARAERALLAVLLDSYPDTLNNDEIAARSTYSRTSSSFSNALSKLRSLELIEGYGQMKAADVFFERLTR